MEEVVMVVVKAVMEEELVKPAAVEELVVVEVKKGIDSHGGDEGSDRVVGNHEGGVGGDGGHVGEGRDNGGRHGVEDLCHINIVAQKPKQLLNEAVR
eukprot:Em0004g945a